MCSRHLIARVGLGPPVRCREFGVVGHKPAHKPLLNLRSSASSVVYVLPPLCGLGELPPPRITA